MSQYRIKNIGPDAYIVQRKVWWGWRTLGRPGSLWTTWHYSLKDAEETYMKYKTYDRCKEEQRRKEKEFKPEKTKYL